METGPLLRVSGLVKSFAAPVLKNISFDVAAGEVVAVTGENGAGKSTLAGIVAGLLVPDAGSMLLHGEPYHPRSRAEAERLGVRIVLQELALISTLSVAENLQLGSLPSLAGFVRVGPLRQLARQQLDRVGLIDVDPAQSVGKLGTGQQQLLEIARGLTGDMRIAILDEPTAMLTEAEVAHLFELVKALKVRGVAVLYISHRLTELSRICDRIVVLRDGQLTCDRPAAQITHDEIVREMVGRDDLATPARPRRTIGGPAMRVEGLTRLPRVKNISFTVHKGEILGIAGLVGAGRTEVLRSIFGVDRRDTGSIYLGGASEATEISSPSRAVECGIGLLPEDRKAQGLLLTQSVRANITLADLGPVSRRGWIVPACEEAAATRWRSRLRIRSSDNDQLVAQLSGGNQQKCLLARWMHRDCQVLLLDEPTRGIDVGARADIYVELQALAAAGKALVMVSSDLNELMHLCDRIVVMSAGHLVRIFGRDEWSEQALLEAAFAAHSESMANKDSRRSG
jgi:ribose transport system ATP-binding protein